MFHCNNCNREFEKPKIIYETHGFSHPPFEVFYLCPFCNSTSFKEAEIKYCRCCGARIKTNTLQYCSDECKIRAEKLRLAEYKRRKHLNESPLAKLIKEVNDYNKNNKTSYSYGQYVAIIKPRSKDNKK